MVNYDKKLLNKTAREYYLKFVIVHGSNVVGTLHSESDFDVAVLGKKEIDFETLLKLHKAFSEVFQLREGMDLDIKSLHRVDPLLRYDVASKGRLLYGDPTEYEEYRAVSQRIYEDAAPLFDLERKLAYKFQKHLNATYARPKISP